MLAPEVLLFFNDFSSKDIFQQNNGVSLRETTNQENSE